MKLYFRSHELAMLSEFTESAVRKSKFILLFGKRKVGKTTLVAEHLKRHKGAYITISLKSSALQLSDISDYLKTFQFTDHFIPTFSSWKEFFEFLFFLAKSRPLTIALDEIHNFELIEPGVFDEIKRLWDRYADDSQLTLIAVTADHDFIKRKFNTPDSPIYRLNNFTLRLNPFNLSEVIKIYQQNSSRLTVEEISKIYLIFGGLPKYYYLIDQYQLWNEGLSGVLKALVLKQYAPLGYELKEILVNEFNRGNKVYLSILQAIAAGNNTMSEIAKAVKIPVTSVTKYLSELERKRALIKRKVPHGTVNDAKSRYGRYFISNYFENFWFRFVQPDIISYEMAQFDKMLNAMQKDIPAYVDSRAENLVREIFRFHHTHPTLHKVFPHPVSSIGSVWNRKDTMEMVVVSDDHRHVLLGKLFTGSPLKEIKEAAELIALMESIPLVYEDYTKKYMLITRQEPDKEVADYLKERNVELLRLADMLDVVLRKFHTLVRKESHKSKPHKREKVVL